MRYNSQWMTRPRSSKRSRVIWPIIPDAGDVIPGAGGATKLRWAAKGKGKRGGARIIYVYVVIAARVFLIRCYAKNVKSDLTADEKKQLRRIAANLKGAQ